ncbi:MAG: hypothetical protein CR978_00515 [Gammaproteobacteria bacterium]|nr:MAG: hypothetical protein CR978_00515 [Gammaproteobacteria bacterium]PIE39570.1 MAG: hypothetical protein CSA53_00815 [Gammaproteobacteria bacterium]
MKTNDAVLSQAIEKLLVSRNLRQMKTAQAALKPGYVLRAATLLRDLHGSIIIGTGFPVRDTFETDGPVGAIALYEALQTLNADPWIACGGPLLSCLQQKYQTLPLKARTLKEAQQEALRYESRLRPHALIAIEHPGLAKNGRYYNMRGEDISDRCSIFDPYLSHLSCPTIAIGDGGNEAGMGNISKALKQLDIKPSQTGCDELIVADVSNWAAYGVIGFLGRWAGKDLLAAVAPRQILGFLSEHGSVDGVTRLNTLTEDGLDAQEGIDLIQDIRRLCHGQAQSIYSNPAFGGIL